MHDFVGRAVDGLNLQERLAISGKWIAMEIYTPANLALRKIAAIGDSPTSCIADLRSRGLDPKKYECFPMRTPY